MSQLLGPVWLSTEMLVGLCIQMAHVSGTRNKHTGNNSQVFIVNSLWWIRVNCETLWRNQQYLWQEVAAIFFHGLSFIYLANNFHSIPTNTTLGPWEPEKRETYLKQKEQCVWKKADSLVWENREHTKQGTLVADKWALHLHKIYNQKWLLYEWKSCCIEKWDASSINGPV